MIRPLSMRRAIIMFGSLAAALPAAALASSTGLQATGEAATYTAVNTDLASLVGGIVGGLLQIIGVVFLVLMVVAGFMWMTASGNEDRVATAKKLIVGAIIGFALVMGSYAITNLVLSSLTLAEPTGELPIEQACPGLSAEDMNCPEGSSFNQSTCQCVGSEGFREVEGTPDVEPDTPVIPDAITH